MAGQATETPQLVNQIEVELLERDEQRVERGRVVAFRREIDVGVVRVAVRVDEAVRPQPRDQIHRAEARADVARAGVHDHVERVEPAEVRQERRARDRIAAFCRARVG